MANVQSTSVPLELSDDGVNWMTLVCLEGWQHTLSKEITETETFCGLAVGLGTTKFSGTADAVCETEPTSNQVTYNYVQAALDGETLLYFRIQSPSSGSTGSVVYNSGRIYINSVQLTAATKETLKFSVQFTGVGTPDITE